MIVLELQNQIVVKRKTQDIRSVNFNNNGEAELWSSGGELMFRRGVGKPACELSLNEMRDYLEDCEASDI